MEAATIPPVTSGLTPSTKLFLNNRTSSGNVPLMLSYCPSMWPSWHDNGLLGHGYDTWHRYLIWILVPHNWFLMRLWIYICIYIYKWFIIGLTTFISRYLFERILVTYALRAYLSKLFSWFLDLDHSKTGKGRGSRFLRLNRGPIKGESWWCHNEFNN